jgi:hypothetical protein
MTRTSLQNVMSLADPAQSWNFDVFFPYLPGSASSSDLTFRAMTTDLPGTSLDVVEAALHGVVIPYAGRRMFTQRMDLTLMETSDWGLRNRLTNWVATARDWVSNSGNFWATYAISGVQLVTYNDVVQPSSVTQLTGVWPISIADVPLNGGESALVSVKLSMAYCYWEIL